MTTEAHDSTTLSAIAPLRDAGFALHWLHPRKKRPIGDRWQEQPVATLEDLRAGHRPGNNLGLRCGEPSLTPAGYLHVLDADIRIDELADEAWDALRKLLPTVDLNTLPCVASGSGGASRHLYFVTEKPFRSKLLLTADGKHRREVTNPETGEVKEKWSYDWEFQLFGTGMQVAMPPSIHPDTGLPYIWEREFDWMMMDLGIGPSIPSSVIEALGAAEAATYAFEAREPLDFKPGQLERELDLIEVSDLDYDDWVRLGQALHHQFGGAQEGFDLWLKHTKRSKKFTGDAQVREMRRIKWRSFGRYRGQPVTMATIRQWAQQARAAAFIDDFDDLDDVATEASEGAEADPLGDILGEPVERDLSAVDPLSDDYVSEADRREKAAAVANGTDTEWQSLLDFNEEGAIKPTLHNVRLIVENDPRFIGVPAYNEFTQEVVQRGEPGVKPGRRRPGPKAVLQLGGQSWELRDKVNGDFWTDDKDNAIRALIEAPKTQGGYGIKVSDRDLKAAVDIAGRKNAFHPVREYLSNLEWDGKPRIERLFIDYLGANDDSYHRSVGRLMMAAAVTRVFEPGHKFDTATILEGLQGKRKSTFISVLARSWFSELDGDFEDAKQMVELMSGSWILEIPELSSFQKADVRHIKAFISRTTDKVRLAYARRAQEFPRQCIFVGSTNDDTYLKDETGGRRYWPVRCNVDQIDTDRLATEVDQMWAEATAVYRQMRIEKPNGILPLYLADDDARVIAERLQESRRVESSDDALAGQIGEWLSKPINNGGFDADGEMRQETCLIEIWCECLGKDTSAYVGAWPSTLGRAMKQISGWTATGARSRFGKYGQQRAYRRV